MSWGCRRGEKKKRPESDYLRYGKWPAAYVSSFRWEHVRSTPLHTRNPLSPEHRGTRAIRQQAFGGEAEYRISMEEESPTSGGAGGLVQERAVGVTLPSRGALDHRRRNDEANFCLLFLFGADQTRLALSIFAVLPSLCDSSPLTSLLVEFERVPSEAATGRFILFPAPQSRLGRPLSFTFALSAALTGERNCGQ
jgi:hypothetical protein